MLRRNIKSLHRSAHPALLPSRRCLLPWNPPPPVSSRDGSRTGRTASESGVRSRGLRGLECAGSDERAMSRTPTTLLLTLVVLAVATAVHAQGFQLAITDAQLERAARDAASSPAAWVFDDVMMRRLVRGDYRTAAGAFVPDRKAFTSMQESAPRRFLVHVATPYMRTVTTFLDARRRFAPMPRLSSERLNADGIVVTVLPGAFADADAIDDIVVKPLGTAED